MIVKGRGEVEEANVNVRKHTEAEREEKKNERIMLLVERGGGKIKIQNAG